MLDSMLSKNERILWRGKPNRLLYTIGSPLVILFMLIFGTIAVYINYFALFEFHHGMRGYYQRGFEPFMIIPLIFLLIPVFALIIMPIYRFFAYSKVEYIVTDRRVYLVSGVFGTDIVNVEYRHVEKLNVNVNPIQNILRVGTVQLTPDQVAGSGEDSRRIAGHRLLHIEEPYEVYKIIRDLSLDVTTDQQFPNKYRPSENRGYNTKWEDD